MAEAHDKPHVVVVLSPMLAAVLTAVLNQRLLHLRGDLIHAGASAVWGRGSPKVRGLVRQRDQVRQIAQAVDAARAEAKARARVVPEPEPRPESRVRLAR